MKIIASVAKSLHQDCGPCYLRLPIFFLNINSPLLLENKKLLWSLLASQIFPNNLYQITDVYSEACLTSKMKCLTKKVNSFYPMTIFAKNSILDASQCSEYASGLLKLF